MAYQYSGCIVDHVQPSAVVVYDILCLNLYEIILAVYVEV